MRPPSSPEVTVALPARNAEGTLGAALDSLLAQDFPGFEILVVDHSSTDRTRDLARKCAERDPRVRILTCGGSFVEAANLAWSEGRAPLVARMDADDIARPERLRAQAEFLREHPGLSGCASLVRILRRGPRGEALPPDRGYRRYQEWINSVITPEAIAAQRFVDSPLPNPATMVRREVLEAAGGYRDSDWAEDYDLWLRLLEDGHRFGKVDRVLLDWLDSPARATRNQERYALSEFQRAKAAYLARAPGLAERGAVLCGAGPTGKEMAALLRERNVPVKAFLEVDEKKIGNRIAEVPVLPSIETSNFAGRAFLLGAVGRPGARERIRKLATDSGFREGEDFFCVA